MADKPRVGQKVNTPDGRGTVERIGINWVWVKVEGHIYRYGFEEVRA